MTRKKIRQFSPDMSRLIVETVRYLRASGFIILPPGRGMPNQPSQAPIYIRNDSGAAIPPFGCVQVTGAVDTGGQNYITVEKPADVIGTGGWYLFNGVAEVEIGGYGIAYAGPECRMLTDGGAIVCGQKWRPVVNQFYTTQDDAGIFSAIGEDDIETNVMRGIIMGLPGCANPVNDVYLDGLSLKLTRCDGTVETIFTGTECP